MADLSQQQLPPRPVLTDEQRDLIKSTAAVLSPEKLGTKITSLMYDKMLGAHHDLSDMFSYSKQAVRLTGPTFLYPL